MFSLIRLSRINIILYKRPNEGNIKRKRAIIRIDTKDSKNVFFSRFIATLNWIYNIIINNPKIRITRFLYLDCGWFENTVRQINQPAPPASPPPRNAPKRPKALVWRKYSWTSRNRTWPTWLISLATMTFNFSKYYIYIMY